jgi:hypothetical protein
MAEQPVHDSGVRRAVDNVAWDRSVGTGQLGQDRWYRTDGTGQTDQDR